MHLLHVVLSILSFSKLACSIPSRIYDTTQQPLVRPNIEPNDNFTLTPIRDALVSNKVIGDVLDDFEPAYYLDVAYPKHNVHVVLGNEAKVKDVKKRPRIGIHVIPDKNKPPSTISDTITFTLVLTDPDATSRYDPKWSEMCHWIVTNITAKDYPSSSDSGAIELDLEEDYAFPFVPEESFWTSKHKHKSGPCKKDKKGGKCLPGELESYFPPGPPPRTGWHRYTFVLLTGDATNLQPPKERKHWGYGKPRHGVRQWANENGLEVVSANFFFAENKKQ